MDWMWWLSWCSAAELTSCCFFAVFVPNRTEARWRCLSRRAAELSSGANHLHAEQNGAGDQRRGGKSAFWSTNNIKIAESARGLLIESRFAVDLGAGDAGLTN
ncbi:hypothetical protein OPV22_029197 [Ensete ventricosum]|uniref:Secreted protein n=1 Tax=Ensete ventricosum TaxID=4639 RepID=A0AAV8Q522_ENSVE|nr:hypothetical protein OPV22_029197 [Ensete ventricosum]